MPSTNVLDSLPDVAIFVRHSPDCPYKGDESHRGCKCRKHLRYSYRGQQRRLSAKTRSWADAEKQRTKLLRQFGLTDDPALESPEAGTTIKQAVDLFLKRKRTENVSHGVVKKYDRELARLQRFCSDRGKMFPEALTLPLLEEFRATWTSDYPSTQTRASVQQRLKGFLRFCHDARWLLQVPRLSTIKVSEPPTLPLSDKQFETLLGKIPTCFPDAERAKKVRALVRLMRFSGLAIMDAVTLERSELQHDSKKKLYRIVTARQKTGTHVSVPIPEDVALEALAVLNGNPKYFFWTGTSKAQSAVTNWQHDLRTLFRAAFGQKTDFTPHSLRDTFACDLLGKGVPLEEVSKLLGHESVKTTERSYAPWVTARQDRLDSLVIGTWKSGN
jgi:integrase/recombinase XerD